MKRAIVVDTNVPVVANGRSEQASAECVTTCVQRLAHLKNDVEKLVLDDHWRIIKEYQNNLCSEGQPGVGDSFLKWVLTNHRNTERCDLVRITPTDGHETAFLEFPSDPDLEGFDPSDRKFVAVAVVHSQRPPILQATDSKWWHFRDAMSRNGVAVEFLCEEDIQA